MSPIRSHHFVAPEGVGLSRNRIMKSSQWITIAVVVGLVVVVAFVTLTWVPDWTSPEGTQGTANRSIPMEGESPEAPTAPPAETIPPLAPPPASPEAGAPRAPSADGEINKNFAVVRVLYATDRNRTMSPKPAKAFGNSRAAVSFGYCDVSIPRDHRMGEVESPSIWRLEFRDDPAKHVVILSTIVRSKDEFFEDLKDRIRASGKSSAFVFIHGYNVTFPDAARRTAQISYDLAFDGVPVFYSWPSQGTVKAYTVDEQNIEWAQADLRSFLEDFFLRSDAQNVYLIAHSMGNRALTRAATSLLADKPALRSRIREVILTAPDIDAEVFKRDIAPALTAIVSPVTLYASSNDLALVASKKVHGYPRAGDSGRGLVVVPGIETIDATFVDTSFLGHSYFAESRSVLSDIFNLVHNGERPDRRFGLRGVDDQAGRHWEFKR